MRRVIVLLAHGCWILSSMKKQNHLENDKGWFVKFKETIHNTGLNTCNDSALISKNKKKLFLWTSILY